MSAIIITPTYNEKGNLKILLEKIFSLQLPDLQVMVVDDNSPDGTGELAEELAQHYHLWVLHRVRREGLGRAYIHAFQEVLRAGKAPDYVIQMDADMSHDPLVIPCFLEKIKTCDLVLGSRYVKGGEIINWGIPRRVISFLGNLFARLVLGLPHRDLTGGFKCWRIGLLKAIDLNSLSSNGYNFQIETTYRAHQKGFKICESPIAFTERKTGVSKFNLGIILESFYKILLLKLRG
ncbi:MAG: polyprenol monophosphomannose synthase [Candidatus Sungiibacteriota bacterium]|uniref:Polyprenol monophosphomannose synthase n=1 Tax=Candidatus Sungiibacteriota bacterium TaxID=2750080 RepID=A0A7T5UPV3_9BACT|nr:MAG: polyprenol monophosphomannose synthase [Candidatus Sungbacteria bacterium]